MKPFYRFAAICIVWGGLQLLASCAAPMVTFYRTVATGAVVTKAAYQALDEADKRSIAAISDHAHFDPNAAKHERDTWLAKYDKARKAIDVADDTAAGALKAGPALEGVIANKRDVSKWVAALTAAYSAVAAALADAGVPFQLPGVQ